MHELSGVKVSTAEAQRLDDESRARLLEQRKLALIVDLDQTIIHATVEPTVGDWMRDRDNPNFEALKNVGTFRLGTDGKAILGHDSGGDDKAEGRGRQAGGAEQSGDDSKEEGCWYYVKPRPGLQDFLRTLSQSYEMHVYTMGTRSYAECVCRLVDPDGTLFGARILSRDENGSMLQKSLKKLFPLDTTMVVIIDDRADVWKWSPNLVKVVPFDFFVGIGDINATFLPAAPSVPAPTTLEGPGGGLAEEDDAASSSSSSAPSIAASSPAASSSTPAASSSLSSKSSSSSPPSEAGQSPLTEKERSEDDATTAEDDIAAKEVADRSQKSAVSAQLGARHLAKMQEALDEKMSEGSAEGAQETSDGSTSAEESAAPLPTPSPSPDPVPSQSPQQRAVLRDDDEELDRVHNILGEIHQQWYAQWDSFPASRDRKGEEVKRAEVASPAVKDILADLKRRVLAGCRIVFSSIVPLETDPIGTDLWRLALEFGATCTTDLESGGVTHVVAAKPGTMKVWMGQKRGLHVVWPAWLHDSAARWRRQPEAWYALQMHQGNPRSRKDGEEVSVAPSVEEEPLAIAGDEEEVEDENEQGAGEGGQEQQEGFQSMDWKEAMDEVDEVLAGLTDDDDDDQTTDGGYSTTVHTPIASNILGSNKRARDGEDGDEGEEGLRSEAESEADDDDDDGGSGGGGATLSPLSKRRRLAELRAGHSKLKMQLNTRDSRSATPNGEKGGKETAGTEQEEQDEEFLKSLEEELELQMGRSEEVAPG